MSSFLQRLRGALFIPEQPDCSGCPVLNALGSLVYYAGSTNRVESAVSSCLPFEAERDCTYGRCRAPGTIRTYAHQVPCPAYRIAVPVTRNRYLRSSVWLAQPLRPGFQFKPASLNPRIGSG